MNEMFKNVCDKGFDLLNKYVTSEKNVYDRSKEALKSIGDRVKNAFSSAVLAVGEANGVHEMRMMNPFADSVAQYASMLKQSSQASVIADKNFTPLPDKSVAGNKFAIHDAPENIKDIEGIDAVS